ncbi:MAG TPA: hypothetical protein VFA76_11525 [Terriglobales bacterium]|nr:hypothetical protein [Terriglobales bacterium]
MQGCPGGADFLPRPEESNRLEDCPQLAEDQPIEYELDEDEPRNDVAKQFMLQSIHMRVPVQVVPGYDEKHAAGAVHAAAVFKSAEVLARGLALVLERAGAA